MVKKFTKYSNADECFVSRLINRGGGAWRGNGSCEASVGLFIHLSTRTVNDVDQQPL